MLLVALATAVHAQIASPPSSAIVDITDANFDELVGSGNWVVEFYADWCGMCTRFNPTYEAFAADLLTRDPTTRVARINVETATITSTRFLVQRLPTLFHISNKAVRQLGHAAFDKDTLTAIVVDRQYEAIKPWNIANPFSYIGSLLWCLGWTTTQFSKGFSLLTQYMPVWAATMVVVFIIVFASLGLASALPNPLMAQQQYADFIQEQEAKDKKKAAEGADGDDDTKPLATSTSAKASKGSSSSGDARKRRA
ncbi:thioredoxin-like protein [Blastocladiella britannica]|nr:thioredoxin-like protein [Blastocladiella britannica]